MPGRDGTGPVGSAGMGGRRPAGAGRGAAGIDGTCYCPACGARVTHMRGVPCTTVTCPKCGARMTRG